MIFAGAVNDNDSRQEQSGVIRAFDVNSGALLWNWDSGNPDLTTPLAEGETYATNSPDSWPVSGVGDYLRAYDLTSGR